MAFILYEIQEPQNVVRISDVELAGKRGVIANFVREHMPADATRFEWRLMEPEILASLGKTDYQRYSLMLDLNPREKTEASLGRVREIRGVYDKTRTSICVCMEIEGVPDAAFEFLELNQRWAWTPTGRLNAPVVNASALNFFTRPIAAPSKDSELDRMKLDLEELLGRTARERLPLPTWEIPPEPQPPPPLNYTSRFSRFISLSRETARRLLSFVRAA